MSPRTLMSARARKVQSVLFAAAIGLVVFAYAPAVAATSEAPEYYPSEAFQGGLDSVLQNPTEREFEYMLDVMLESPHSRWGDYVEYTILALRDHYTERMNGFIDSNFINPPPPSPPPPPAPPTTEPPVVWPTEAFQQTVDRLFQHPTDQEFNYALDQMIGSVHAENYVEYIVLELRGYHPQRVNDFVRYLWSPTP